MLEISRGRNRQLWNVSFVIDSFLACLALAASDSADRLVNSGRGSLVHSSKQGHSKNHRTYLPVAALAALGCGLGASAAHAAPFPTLGAAAFTVLDINGGNLDINNANGITTNPGKVGIGPNVSSTLQKATITGNVTVDPTDTYSPSADFIVTGTTTTQSLVQAQTDANNASAAFDALTPTVTFTGNHTTLAPITGNGGVNVIDINGDLNLNGTTIDLHGGANDIFVFNITGTLSYSNSQMILDSGITASHIIFNLVGTGLDNEINKASDVFDGTVLASPFSSVRYHNPATFDGAIIAENIQFGFF